MSPNNPAPRAAHVPARPRPIRRGRRALALLGCLLLSACALAAASPASTARLRGIFSPGAPAAAPAEAAASALPAPAALQAGAGSSAQVGTLDTTHYIPPFYAPPGLNTSNDINRHYLALSTPSTTPFTVNIRNADNSLNKDVTISKGVPEIIDLSSAPYGTANYGSRGIVSDAALQTVNNTSGLILTANEPFYANVRHNATAQGDSLTAKGQTALGTRFRAGFMNTSTTSAPGAQFAQFVSVMATADATTVTFSDIRPGVIFRLPGGTTTTATPGPVTLNAGESYVVGVRLNDNPNTARHLDFTGALIKSTRPVVVNTGSWLSGGLNTVGRDIGFDQILPASLVGTDYVLSKGLATGTAAEVLEVPIVVADSDNTQIFLNGGATPVATINAGDYHAVSGANYTSSGTMYVRTSRPAYVYQTTAGSDSSANIGMSFVVPLSDAIQPQEVNIASVNLLGTATMSIIAPIGAQIELTGGTPSAPISLNPPVALVGISGYELYKKNVTGNVSVVSDKPLFISVITVNGNATSAAYFSGVPNRFAVSDSAVTALDTPINVDVLANDNTGAGSFNVTSATDPANGTAVLNPDGTITYMPDGGFTGSDTFDYTITSGLLSGTTTVTVNVLPSVYNFTQAAFSAPRPLAPTVTDVVTVARSGDTSGAGSIDVQLFPGAGVPATPGSDFVGGTFTVAFAPGETVKSVPIQLLYDTSNTTDETISLALSGAGAGKSQPTAALTLALNTAPVAAADSYSTDEDAALDIPAPGVLANDTDGDSPSMTASVVSATTNGALSLNPDGSFTYTPAPNYRGADSFTYVAGDGSLDSAPAVVTIIVNPVNDAPAAGDGSLSTYEDEPLPLMLDASDSDGDALTYTVSGPAHGTLSGAAPALVYTPAPNYSGPDSFSFKVNDGAADSNVATISVNVVPTNDAPTVNGGSFSVKENSAAGTIVGGVTAVDPDAGDTLAYAITAGNTGDAFAINPATGQITVANSSALDYETAPSFALAVTATDAGGLSGTAPVTVSVGDLNEAPVNTVPGAQTVYLTQTIVFSAANGNALSVTDDSGPNGALQMSLTTDRGTLTLSRTTGLTFIVGDGTADASMTFRGKRDDIVAALEGLVYTSSTAGLGTLTMTTNDLGSSGSNPTGDLAGQITNGGFETPFVSNNNWALFAASQVQPWSTTDSKGQIELWGDGFGSTPAFEGRQFAEINANSAGTLSTTAQPTAGRPAEFFFAHRARGSGTETIRVRVTDLGPDAVAGGGDDTSLLDENFTDGRTAWGSYQRDLGVASGNKLLLQFTAVVPSGAQGNLIDGIRFGAASLSDTDTVSIDNINATPTVSAGGPYSVAEGSSVQVSATGNSPIGSALSYDWDLDNNGSFETPGQTATFNAVNGPATRTVKARVTDAANRTAIANATVNVTNVAPTAVDDSYTVNAGSQLTVAAPGVLSNDTDPADALTAALVSGPAGGTLTLNSNGSFTYKPASGFVGNDSFTYRASDGAANSNTATVNITVNKQNQTITFGPLADRTYGNAPFALAASASSGLPVSYQIVSGPAAVSGSTVTLSGAGLVTVRASQAGNGLYNAAQDVEQSFTVNKAALIVRADDKTKTYGDPAVLFTVSYAGLVNGDGPASLGGALAFNFADAAITPAGAHTVTPSGLISNNYSITFAGGTLTVNKAASEVGVSVSDATYDGQPHGGGAAATGAGGLNQTLAVTYAGRNGTNYPASPAPPVNAGDYTASASYAGGDNHTGSTASRDFTIGKANAVVNVSGYSVTYDGQPHTATGTAAGVESPAADLSGLLDLSATTHTGAGVYPADAWTFAGNNNYHPAGGTVSSRIDKAASSVTVTCPASETYTGSAMTPCSVSVAGTGLSLSPAPDYANNVNVGTASASYTFGGDDNHTGGGDSKTFQITPAASAVALSFEDGPYVYRGSAFMATARVSGAGNLDQPVSVTYAGDCSNVTAADGCTATATYDGDANHTGSSASRSITITKAGVTISLAGLNQTYTGTPRAVQASTDPSGLPGLTVTYDGSGVAPTNVGSYQVVAKLDNQNYQADDASSTLTVSPAVLTVKTDDASKTYGDPAVAFTATFTGFVNGEQPSSLAGALGFDFADSNATGAGSYAVTPSGLSSPNYTINYAAGTFTVAKADQTIAWSDPAGIVYGTPLSGAQLNAAVTVAGPSAHGAVSYGQAAGQVLGAGQAQALTVSVAGTSNYNPATRTVRIDVAKATPVVNWNTPAAVTYGVAISATQLNAGAAHPADGGPLAGTALPGTFDYTPAAGAVLPVGNNTLSTVFTPGDSANYTTATRSVVQRVNFGVCALYDQTKSARSGSTIPVKLTLCSASGTNLSTSGIVVTAIGTRLVSPVAWGAVEDAGNANPDMNFRFTTFDPATPGYIFNLQTKGLSTGTYQLGFYVGSDPAVYTVQFQIK